MTDQFIILFHYLTTKYWLRFTNKTKLATWQQKQLKRFIKTTLTQSPLYAKYKGNFNEFPIMNKHAMMTQFNQLNTAHINVDNALACAAQAEQSRNFVPMLGSISVGLSSGTSGNRGIFVASKAERLQWAGVMLAKTLPSSILNKQSIALFLRANNNLYTTLNRSNRIKFSFFDLIKPMDKLLSELHALQPTILVAPPQVLRIIAQAQAHKRINLRLQKIISAAEVLETSDKRYIESCFNQPLHQLYQCTEGFLATTCAYNTLHLNEEFILIEKEWLDEQQERFIPIITDFNRTTQPIVRYRLNDVLVIKKTACPCKSATTALERIEGRCDDIFYGIHTGTNILTPIFADFITRSLIAIADMPPYKVIQLAPTTIELQLAPSNIDQRDATQAIINIFTTFNCMIPTIIITPYSEDAPTKKLRCIERRFIKEGILQ